MKRSLFSFIAIAVGLIASAQTLNVQVGNAIDQYSASTTGEMTYSSGTALTILNKSYSISDITKMYTDESTVTNNEVKVVYSGTTALVYVAGNIAQYVTPTINGAYVTIAQTNTDAVDEDEITYVLSGSATDGQFALSGSYKCTISLAGVDLTCSTGAAINITNSKRIQISAKDSYTNTLTDCASGSQKACIYSKGQLQLQGKGTLNVVGNTKHGIKSASYISIKNLTLNITSAVGDAINCEEYFLMKSGTVTLSGMSDDGIQCDLGGSTSTGEMTDHEDEDSGNMYLEGGTLTVTATGTATKCMKCDGSISVSGGTYKMNAQGAIDTSDTTDLSYAAGFKADGDFTQSGGDITINVTGASGRGIGIDGTFTTTSSSSGTLTITNSGALSSSGSTYFATAKGIKAGVVAINGGTIDITMSGAAAKGIKSDSDDGSGNTTISGGTITITTTGTGAYDSSEKDSKGSGCLKADNNMTISGGTLTLKSTGTGGKGIKTDGTLTITGGNIEATTTGGTYTSNSKNSQPKAIKADGAMTVSGGTVNASSSGHEAIETKSTLTISSGTVYAFSSSDDAINSAGNMYLKGGTVTGISNGNDGIDSNGNMYISGGTVMGCGAGGAECGLDAAEQHYLYITGGNVLAVGGSSNNVTSTNGSQCVLATTGSVSAGTSISVKSSSSTLASFTIPSGYSPSSGGGMMAITRAGGGPGGGGNNPGGGGSSSSFKVVVSCSGLSSGNTYTVTVGSSSSSCTASTSYSGGM